MQQWFSSIGMGGVKFKSYFVDAHLYNRPKRQILD
jgi:hypothetical protein